MGIFFKAFSGGFFGKLFAAVFIAICVSIGFGPDKWATAIISHDPLWLAIVRGIFIVVAITYISILIWQTFKKIKYKNPIQIIFDSTNPSRRYWQFTNAPDPKTSQQFAIHLYRVLLKNASDKTIEDVRATVETTGSHGMIPQLANFQINDQPVFTLHPGEEKFIDVIKWPHPIRQAGFPTGETARQMYGDLKISVTAKEMQQIVKILKFDYEKEPMISES